MCNTSGNYVSAAVAKTANPASTKTLKCPLSLAFCQGTGLPNSVSIWSIQDMGYDISPSVVACSPVTAPLVLPGSPQAYKTHQGYKRSRTKGSRPGEAEAQDVVADGGRAAVAERRPAAPRDEAPTAAAHHPRGTLIRSLWVTRRAVFVIGLPEGTDSWAN